MLKFSKIKLLNFIFLIFAWHTLSFASDTNLGPVEAAIRHFEVNPSQCGKNQVKFGVCSANLRTPGNALALSSSSLQNDLINSFGTKYSVRFQTHADGYKFSCYKHLNSETGIDDCSWRELTEALNLFLIKNPTFKIVDVKVFQVQ